MKPIPIILAVEDQLSEMVARKILKESMPPFMVTQCLGNEGFGYLKAKVNAFNQAARGFPFFVLTDQDSGCPPDKISDWIQGPLHPNMLFRIAVMEIESWVMADRDAFAKFLEIPLDKIPLQTDTIQNPKQFLLSLAQRSKVYRLRQDLVPPKGATSTQGPNYNGRLCGFVEKQWRVQQAKRHSESLNRALIRLQKFRQR